MDGAPGPPLNAAAAIWALAALPALAAGLAGWDPVGRLGDRGAGKRIDARWAWFLFELPALVTFPAIYVASGNTHFLGDLAVVIWLAHYGHRTLVWPWLVPKREATAPLALCVSSIGFNLVNGGLFGWFMGYAADYPDQWLTDPRFVGGLALFVGGATLNVWADYRLRRLRMGNTGSVVPTGGPFNLVCCPNLAGEIVEWVGFALLTWSLPGLAFALWTIANLVPRALWRRDWYRENFDGYPKERAALFPGVL
ncbi:MAG: 3-oxo-5-alpha-steroid 4-dehydrogenase [Gammaproteobacteria bacterium]|nr:3-oxo-5-alpha-steroid 4-dehydrogenase [Gammaproteobacteria bacterium]MDE0192447.1 3-oxo-5-alpha-steroid 4-dehydrogenase [Gammaproteobacteria bacterium]